ncbi:hypothetical protein AXG93_2294s1400 [Marchantia polymorpha subsp. ruderalis]|uniref:Uncharacterized protein n=1 Tax=Marchantia polymorpha subsp. ruderalis TaxID=1480154 RepID=A0A176WH08_MARPO|nr:hypothetical protein AXG93_2294s1400 [Marchantia polymorpha subsp. ruderalis]
MAAPGNESDVFWSDRAVEAICASGEQLVAALKFSVCVLGSSSVRACSLQPLLKRLTTRYRVSKISILWLLGFEPLSGRENRNVHLAGIGLGCVDAASFPAAEQIPSKPVHAVETLFPNLSRRRFPGGLVKLYLSALSGGSRK